MCKNICMADTVIYRQQESLYCNRHSLQHCVCHANAACISLCLPCRQHSPALSLSHAHTLYTHIHTHIHTHREVCKNICMADTVIYRQHSINAWYFSDSTGKINKKQHTKEFTTRCCSVLRCVAACYSVLQCVAVCCSVLQCVAVW